MKKGIIIILLIASLFLISCSATDSPFPGDASSGDISSVEEIQEKITEPLPEEKLLQQFPDYLDEALAELDLVE